MKKIIKVAVCGGFDPLHIGHIEYLEKARQLGDKLIVILNNDNWLMKKKGFCFMNEKERKKILESLKFVDEVVLTGHQMNPEDMSTCETLKRIKPDILAKGGDKNRDNIPETKLCDELGIKIVDGLGEKIQSSSTLLKKMMEK